ncbi:MAG: hypothetical protein Fur002_00750 [Anaerolineales bacterium]
MNIETDLAYLKAALPELERYLLSAELYYPLEARLRPLTLGGVELALARTAQRVESRGARVRVDSLRAERFSAWQTKAAHEVKSRASLWSQYLAEYTEDNKSNSHLYAQQVYHRAILSLLGAKKHAGDFFLKSVFREGSFIWEAESAPSFPRETFWYLFGNIKE